jgi:hypothetical protein
MFYQEKYRPSESMPLAVQTGKFAAANTNDNNYGYPEQTIPKEVVVYSIVIHQTKDSGLRSLSW